MLASISAAESKIMNLESEHKEIADKSIIREMLINIFGTRGIQNYVFLGLLKQIEFIANSYLEILADGGIQLSLVQEVDSNGAAEEKKKRKSAKEKSAVKVRRFNFGKYYFQILNHKYFNFTAHFPLL